MPMPAWQVAYNASRRAYIQQLKSGPCADCGKSFPPEAMDFDHVNGQKSRPLSRAENWSLERIALEVAKCDLVCANCHRIRTALRAQYQGARP